MSARAGRREAEKLIKTASDAHVRLNTFYSVIAILEGGCLPGGSETADRAAQRIISICQTEGNRQLSIYDKSIAAAIRSLASEDRT